MIRLRGDIRPDEALSIYLQDHHAGAQAGLALARRAARNRRGSEAGRVLDDLVTELEEDEQTLERVMDTVGASPSPVKGVGAQLLERVGRLKLNGQLTGTSPLSPVIELEGLLSAIKSKQHVWILLRDAAGVPLGDVDPDRMLARAESQIERLYGLWRDAGRSAFV